MESPKWVGFHLLRSVIRLQPLNDCRVCWQDARKHCDPSLRIILGVSKDGELCTITGRPVQSSKGANNVVESGTEIVRELTDNNPHGQRGLIDIGEAKNALSRFRVEIGTDSVHVSLVPFGNPLAQIRQVIICPFEFRSDAI